MATYSTLSRGSTGEDVKNLQTALNAAGYNSGAVDGIFGSQTLAALNAYKSANGLSSDGTADDSTLNKLYGTETTTTTEETTNEPVNPSVSDFSAYTYESSGYDSSQNQAYQAAMAKLNALGDTYDPTSSEAYNTAVAKLTALGDKPTFSYDVNSDPVYDALKSLYTAQGKQAMADTVGQGAALTGGYDNTYAQTAGQETYDTYLQQLNQYVPDLYDSAYNRYENELSDYNTERSYLTNERDTAYNNGYNNYNNDRSFWQNEASTAYTNGYNDYINALNTGLEQQQNAYENLVTKISTLGYSPSEQELANAGMSQEEANAWLNYYQEQQTSSSGSGGTSGNSGSTRSEAYSGVETYISGLLSKASSSSNPTKFTKLYKTSCTTYLGQQVANKNITEEEGAYLASKYGLSLS